MKLQSKISSAIIYFWNCFNFFTVFKIHFARFHNLYCHGNKGSPQPNLLQISISTSPRLLRWLSVQFSDFFGWQRPQFSWIPAFKPLFDVLYRFFFSFLFFLNQGCISYTIFKGFWNLLFWSAKLLKHLNVKMPTFSSFLCFRWNKLVCPMKRKHRFN